MRVLRTLCGPEMINISKDWFNAPTQNSLLRFFLRFRSAYNFEMEVYDIPHRMYELIRQKNATSSNEQC